MTGTEQTYDLMRPPVWQGGVIFASPHSGRCYPDWFLAESRLDPVLLRSSEDAFIDRLIAPALDFGAVVLTANVPRCIVDLNRGPHEIDPLVVEGASPAKTTPRIMAGLGIIPRVVSQGRVIHDRPIPRAEAERRIAELWRPYHAALQGLVAEAVARFGGAVLIDMHSMPHDALAHLPRPRPDMVLGDRNGVSASPRISAQVAEAVAAEGFSLRRNSPFSGAYITATYGRPRENVHVVQLELDRSLYMDERRVEPRADFDRFRDRFRRLVARLARLRPDACDPAIAAE
ncbi:MULTISPECIES: N-formylglutamate amidohydrolase [unclassified Paracoccus (in: a-proteobacteria)]|uniref:N-formylglutamate amidohydrolase n=1 Tax=unclassified Paracoccus (in: a-proteobacteria) TaxID=2688777 RepID=UPI0012B3A11B|nr:MULTISPECIES: N-formylglutamate amidohydrolase [unclassified Paracoccus (in: a-proteobacteria)]UXU75698.1 N-formylglutamate amidohydrolase [Paracoccus sp. SMMA_5]UXU81603.1 N-formylglutamate amidohydrolase [Paracoccus sp. SMMA_5_TC]